jgi:hypothetical protein
MVKINGIDFRFEVLKRSEQKYLAEDGYLPVLMKGVEVPEAVILITTDCKVELWHNHRFNGSGTSNFVLGGRFDLEFCGSGAWYSNATLSPQNEMRVINS